MTSKLLPDKGLRVPSCPSHTIWKSSEIIRKNVYQAWARRDKREKRRAEINSKNFHLLHHLPIFSHVGVMCESFFSLSPYPSTTWRLGSTDHLQSHLGFKGISSGNEMNLSRICLPRRPLASSETVITNWDLRLSSIFICTEVFLGTRFSDSFSGVAIELWTLSLFRGEKKKSLFFRSPSFS